MRILVVEDQENLAKLIKNGLEAEGFAVDYVLDGKKGMSWIEVSHKDYDCIILDIMLPYLSGVEICRQTRALGIKTPIIMLTAQGGVENKINGLNVGADDYVVKPFSFKELLARIKAIMRRPQNSFLQKLNLGDITLDPNAKKVYKKNKEVPLTLKEYSLFEYLMRHPNKVLNREEITNNVWDFNFDSFSNVIDVHITNLRKKLADDKGKIIKTVRGVGYIINK